jgi:TPR repeat protein
VALAVRGILTGTTCKELRARTAIGVALLMQWLFVSNDARAIETSRWKDAEISSDGVFLKYHPDQFHRRMGLAEYAKGNYAEALRHFKLGAKFADKASQAFVAGMLWQGIGVERDPVAAYAWMDLASERGFRTFLKYREHYWSQLSESERLASTARGREVYARYGDEVAKKRLERLLRMGDKWAYASVTHRAYAKVNGLIGFYDDKYWQPRRYWEWQDVVVQDAINESLGVGRVEIGPLQPMHEPQATP